jgi:hypothetical protein
MALAISVSGQTPPEPGHDVSDLAKQVQNPVSSLVSLPFQFNFNTGGGLQDETLLNINFQPVIPIRLNSSWNLIARTIVPINSFPGPEGTRFSGVGDFQEQFFFSPSKASTFIWGVGPVFSMPTATAAPAKTGTWGVGPSAVLLTMKGPWVVGALVNQIWPFYDRNDKPKTDLFFFQWFVNYNFGKGWAITAAPSNTANWDAEEGQRWTVPLGIGISRTTVFNRQPINLGVQYYSNIKRPSSAPASQLRFTLSFLYPLGK